MRIVLFYHSLISDWNHGNAHFLRGIASELIERGHEVRIYEPAAGWSLISLYRDQGEHAVDGFHRHYPRLASQFYDPARIDLDRALAGADLVLVHEWNDQDFITRVDKLFELYDELRPAQVQARTA